MDHVCAHCQYVEESKKAACAAAKLARQMALPTYNQGAWDAVKKELRPILAAAVISQDWEKVYEIWRNNKWMVERAVLGK